MYRITGHYLWLRWSAVVPEVEPQLAHGSRERWLVDGDIDPGRSDDDVAMNSDTRYRFG
jgi:hypothetical protein